MKNDVPSGEIKVVGGTTTDFTAWEYSSKPIKPSIRKEKLHPKIERMLERMKHEKPKINARS